MNLSEHFNSYRQSVLKDSLEDSTWYAQQRATKNPAAWPTAYDYTTYVLGDIKLAIERGNEANYKIFLQRHQQAMIALFEAMVEEELWGYSNLKGEDLLRLIDNRGPKWFKFSKHSITMKLRLADGAEHQMTWVPRYSEAFARLWREPAGHLVFDADELYLLRSCGKDMLKVRQNFPGMKAFLLTPGGSTTVSKTVESINKDQVRDWTLPLFSEVH